MPLTTSCTCCHTQVENAFAYNYSMVPPYHEAYWMGLTWNASATPGPRFTWTDRWVAARGVVYPSCSLPQPALAALVVRQDNSNA